MQKAYNAVDEFLAKYKNHKRDNLYSLFQKENNRLEAMSASFAGFYLDISKTAISHAAFADLLQLARQCSLQDKIAALFAGQRINETQNRSVLHMACRGGKDFLDSVDGEPISANVHSVLNRFLDFAEGVRKGNVKGVSGHLITDVVHIGIGGSDLGPRFVVDAMMSFQDGPTIHFASNVDPADLGRVLARLNPNSTFIIVASKTFTTQETMANALAARAWIVEALGEHAVEHHFVALSTNLEAVEKFGITEDRTFGFWDWVGGRYSVWSAIGLPVALAIGSKLFKDFLQGAKEMDDHFRNAAFEKNLPVMLALAGYWHRAVCGYSSRAVVPYARSLSLFTSWLQQLDMESNGKSIRLDGSPVQTETGPVVWGGAGTDSQHSFFQLLHQGTDIIPVEFILCAQTAASCLDEKRHSMLLANGLAQSQALMLGRTAAQAKQDMLDAGMTPDDAERLAPHRSFSGNRPSITLLLDSLTPRTLGGLMALYEHRVFVEGVLYGINSYDQWGVELGKVMAKTLLPLVDKGEAVSGLDPSTLQLASRLKEWRGSTA
jgi:glucose-6-phosphate isomerase